MVGAQRPNGFIWALLPRPDYEILDTWFTSGMRGTGSKDIVIRDVFVPEYRTMDPSRAGDGEWTGWELHKRLSYRLPLRCMTGWDLVAPLVGIAQGAIDEFTASLRGTSGPGRTADSVLVQVRLAEAAVEVDAARELHRRAIRDMLEKAERGEEFTASGARPLPARQNLHRQAVCPGRESAVRGERWAGPVRVRADPALPPRCQCCVAPSGYQLGRRRRGFWPPGPGAAPRARTLWLIIGCDLHGDGQPIRIGCRVTFASGVFDQTDVAGHKGV